MTDRTELLEAALNQICLAVVILFDKGECVKLWAGLIFGDEMDNQTGI